MKYLRTSKSMEAQEDPISRRLTGKKAERRDFVSPPPWMAGIRSKEDDACRRQKLAQGIEEMWQRDRKMRRWAGGISRSLWYSGIWGILDLGHKRQAVVSIRLDFVGVPRRE